MDIGIQATCQRCTQKFNLYKQTHSFSRGRIAGICPLCNQMVTVLLPAKNGRDRYNKLILYPHPSLRAKGNYYADVPYYRHED